MYIYLSLSIHIYIYIIVAEFISPKKYTFRFIVGNIIPKSVKCIRSATKIYTLI